MKNTKKKLYADMMNLNGIDTLSGYVPYQVQKNDIAKEIRGNIAMCSYQTDKQKTFLKINPNIIANTKNEKLITSYFEFINKLTYIFECLGVDINTFEVTRVDFCLNSKEQNSFNDYQKLHRLLICCISKALGNNNNYESYEIDSKQVKSIVTKSYNIEIENYDKLSESNGKDESTNRLELRTKKMDNGIKIKEQVIDRWKPLLKQALDNFDMVQIDINNNLERIYREDLQQPAKSKKFLSMKAFLIHFEDIIFTRKQMIDLLARLEVINPTNRANKFKDGHYIEYFSKADLKYIVEKITNKMQVYFDNKNN